MIQAIDKTLNTFTMYRVALYGLFMLALIAILFAFLGIISYPGFALVLSLAVLIGACATSNFIFAKIFKAQTNVESSYITALILFLIIIPPAGIMDLLTLLGAGTLSMLSKYVLAIHKRHLFNPAALAAVLLGIFQSGGVIWWVATPALLPFTFLVGLLIVRKIRRFTLFFSFLSVAIVSILLVNNSGQGNLFLSIQEIFVSWPLIFFGTVMLTEPLTTPAKKKMQIIYGGLVGAFFGAQFHIGPIFSSPELALIVGNVFSYVVSPQKTLKLKLKKRVKLSENLYDFLFSSDGKIPFTPGQYVEWTLTHKDSDTRGNRRYFTIASSPKEGMIRLGTKIDPTKSSSFKRGLLGLSEGQELCISQVTGDFILPKDVRKKLVFIAGGIGITPFRSIIQHLVDCQEKRDVVLFYAVSHEDEFVYKDVFEKAKKTLGIKTVYVITHAKEAPKSWGGKVGYITQIMIAEEVPDYKNRLFYISGPDAMTSAYKTMLLKAGVSPVNIVTDYFPGF